MSSGAANFFILARALLIRLGFAPSSFVSPTRLAIKSETVLEIGHFDRGFCVISSPLEAFLIDLVVW